MPSQLYDNDGISFVCARNFTYNGESYEMGEDFPQEDLVDSPEVLVRSRYLIPVVESRAGKPRHWHREIQLKEDVLAKMGRSGESLLNKPPRVNVVASEDLPVKEEPETEEKDEPVEEPVEEPSTEEPTPKPEPTVEEPSTEPQTEPEAPTEQAFVLTFDPSEHTVPEVNEYLSSKDISVEEYNEVIQAEKRDKHRVGILNEHQLILEEASDDA